MAEHAHDSVLIHASMDQVWRVTRDVASWAVLFAENVGVEMLGRDGGLMRFQLTVRPDDVDVITGRVAEGTLDEHTRTVTVRRLDLGPFESMDLRWQYVPEGGGVRAHWTQRFAVKPVAGADTTVARRYLERLAGFEMANFALLVESRAGRPVFRVLARVSVVPGREPEFERLWRQTAQSRAQHNASVGQALMRSHYEKSVYYTISDWIDEAGFREFERSDAHLAQLRLFEPVRSSGSVVTTEVVAEVTTPLSGE